jgi:hypothetical protein
LCTATDWQTASHAETAAASGSSGPPQLANLSSSERL